MGSQKIEFLRKALNDSIIKEGIISNKVLRQSRKLDDAIMDYYRNTAQDNAKRA